MKIRSARILTLAMSKTALKAGKAVPKRGHDIRLCPQGVPKCATDGKTLWVRTVAGPAIGFGHLRRTLVLANMLESSARPLFLLDPGDRWSRQQVRSSRFEFVKFEPCKPWPDCEPPAAILIDTRKEAGLGGLIEEARRRKIPVVSIHDLGLVPLASDVVIDGSILPFYGSSPRGEVRSYRGTSYLVLDPAFASFRHQPRRIAPGIGKVVINLGGGNSSRCFQKILQGLRSAGLSLEVVGIPGFMAWGQENFAHECWHPLQFRWASQDESIAELISGADLAITAGGLAAYETLCLGTPLCALSYDRFQRITVEALVQAGACADLGPGKSLTSARVSSRFMELAGNQDLRRHLALQGRRIVDGIGAQRVVRILRRILKDFHPKGAQKAIP